MNRGQQLEGYMTNIFLTMREAEQLTQSKIDLSFILDIVGSYIVAKESNNLAEGYKEPWELFEERIFPIVDDSTITVEEVEKDGDSLPNEEA